MAYEGRHPLPVTSGCTGNSTLTANGVLVGEGTSAIGATGTGAATSTLLIGNGASADPTYSATPQVTGLGIGAASTGSGLSFDHTNTLSAFTQGTFSPTVIGATGSSGQVYSVQVGRYQRVGRIVNIYACVIWTANTSTGAAQVASFPFTFLSTTNVRPVFASGWGLGQNLAPGAATLGWSSGNNNATTANLYKTGQVVGAVANLASVSSGSIILTGNMEV